MGSPSACAFALGNKLLMNGMEAKSEATEETPARDTFKNPLLFTPLPSVELPVFPTMR